MFMMDNSKEDIILEIGGECIRVGVMTEKVPKKTIPADVLYSYQEGIEPREYENSIEEMLFKIFFSYINCSSVNKTVVIVEKVYTDRRIIETLARVLFRKFKIQKLEFSLSCVTPLYLSGRYSGIVVSGGGTCVEIMPVFESYPLFRSFKYISSGTRSMNKVIKDQIILQNPDLKPDLQQKLTEEYLTELRNQYSNMNWVKAQNEEPVAFMLKRTKLKMKPGSITYSNLFGNPQDEEHNIAWAFLQVLDSIPTEALESIISNVVFAGGLWRVKGMQNYFKEEVVKFLPSFPKLEKSNLKQNIRFVSWSFNPSDISWIGASIGASIKSVDAMCLKRVDFEKTGFSEKIMENYFLSE